MFALLTYTHRWEFALGWILLVFWAALTAFSGSFAIHFAAVGAGGWPFQALICAWSALNFIKFAKELRFNYRKAAE